MSGDQFLSLFRAHSQFEKIPVVEISRNATSKLGAEADACVQPPFEAAAIKDIFKNLL
jgi:hypothetical protein